MPPVDLSSAERRQLHAALSAAFWNEGRLGDLLFLGDGLNVTLAAVTAPKALSEMVTAIIQWAEGESKTEALVRAALTRTTNLKVKAFAGRYLASAQRQVDGTALEKLTDSAVTFKEPQSWRDCMAAAERRVCAIVIDGQREGSGFLVAPGLVMTNYHVVEDCDWTTIKVEFDYRADANGVPTVSRFCSLTAAPIATSPWHPIDKEHPKPAAPPPDHTALDFAILPVDGAPEADVMPDGSKRGVIGPPKAAPRLQAGMPLLILQHPKQLKTFLETPDLQPLRFAFDVVIEINENASRVRYKVNSEPGSSGSPCFDPDWNLVALHHAGDPREIVPAEYNEGIPIDTIRANLSAALRAQLLWA